MIARGELGLPVVVKADGLAAGKGVVVAATRDEADAAIRAAMEDRHSAMPARRVVIEECLSGPEVSFFALCDGHTRDTTGHGAGSQADLRRRSRPEYRRHGRVRAEPARGRRSSQPGVMRDIVEPVIRGMRAEGHEYRGFLYAGLMLTCDGPKVIEFNVRFGDPEAQVVLPLIESDLPPLLAAAADGALAQSRRGCGSRADVAVGVVLASAGYPGPVDAGSAH